MASGAPWIACHEALPRRVTKLGGARPCWERTPKGAERKRTTPVRVTRTTLRPGANGTKKLSRLYGDRLVCVRYLYDTESRRRFTTVELIVDEGPWLTPESPDTLVAIAPKQHESTLRATLRAAGATWDWDRRAFLLRYDKVASLGLKGRIQRSPPRPPGSAAP